MSYALDPIEETALLQAYWRATESRSAAPRLTDPLACDVTDAHVDETLAARFSSGPVAATYAQIHVASVLAADRCLAAWNDSVSGERQIVVLGCGFDGRAQRLSLGHDTVFYLVDRRRVVDLLSGRLAPDRARLRLVEGNLSKPDELLAALAAAQWRPELPTVFVAEGIVEFLGASKTQLLIRALRGAATAGTMLVQVLDPSLVAFAANRGDAGFPWRKLPRPEDIFGADIVGVREVQLAGPSWQQAGRVQALVHLYAVSL